MDYRRKRLLMASNNLMLAAILMQQCKNEEDEEEAQSLQDSKKPRSCWVNPYLQERAVKGRFATDFMTKNPKIFLENFHMTHNNFNKLYDLLLVHLVPKRNSRPNDAIFSQTKLAMVLEFLTSGKLQHDVGTAYRVSKQRVGYIIDLVCDAICMELKNEVPAWEHNTMLQFSKDFENLYSLPNCIGAIGGTHVPIKAVFTSKNSTCSLVLIAICNASHTFTYLDVAGYGNQGERNIILNSKFGKDILEDQVEFPNDRNKLPYFLIGGEAFPLCKRIMKPYSTRFDFGHEEEVFNEHIKKALSSSIENTFGILSWKWMCMQHPLYCKPERAQKIISACCLLHNYLMRIGREDYIGDMEWRKEQTAIPEILERNALGAYNGRYHDYAKHVRNTLRDRLVEASKKRGS